jgi:hypothetical protein
MAIAAHQAFSNEWKGLVRWSSIGTTTRSTAQKSRSSLPFLSSDGSRLSVWRMAGPIRPRAAGAVLDARRPDHGSMDYLGQVEIFQIDFAGHRSLLAMKGGANNRIKTFLVPTKRPRMGFRREVQSVVDPDLFARARELSCQWRDMAVWAGEAHAYSPNAVHVRISGLWPQRDTNRGLGGGAEWIRTLSTGF